MKVFLERSSFFYHCTILMKYWISKLQPSISYLVANCLKTIKNTEQEVFSAFLTGQDVYEKA